MMENIVIYSREYRLSEAFFNGINVDALEEHIRREIEEKGYTLFRAKDLTKFTKISPRGSMRLALAYIRAAGYKVRKISKRYWLITKR